MTEKRSTRMSRRSAAAGIVLIAAGLMLVVTGTAGADGPAVFGPGYDTYLKATQRGSAAEGAEKEGSTCPDLPDVDGETAWHFVLDGNAHDFLTLDVAFALGGNNITILGLTPKAANDPTFDPDLNFAPEPDGKHAYVFTSSSGTLRDAAAHVTPDAVIDDFQLSHTCVGEGVTTTTSETTTTTAGETTTTAGETTTTTAGETTTTTAGETTTTAGETTTSETVLGSTVTQGQPTTSETVLGEVINRDLPATGSWTVIPTAVGALLVAMGLCLLSEAKFRAARH